MFAAGMVGEREEAQAGGDLDLRVIGMGREELRGDRKGGG